MSTGILLVATPVVLALLDKIFPLQNGGSRLILPIHADYIFFETKNHFYVVTIHFAIVCFASIGIYICHDSFFVLSVYHVCGVLAVVR